MASTKDNGQALKKINGRYISLALFKAYDREMSEFWTDEQKPLVEEIELRIIEICHTAVIHTVKIIDTSCPE